MVINLFHRTLYHENITGDKIAIYDTGKGIVFSQPKDISKETVDIINGYKEADILPFITDLQFQEKTKGFMDAVQEHLDSTAQSWGYDNIISLCSYAGNSHPKYSMEGAAGLSWRSSVWDHCEKELAAISAETRVEPESVESFIGELPVIVRPV